MADLSPSALITDQGRHVLLRIKGRLHDLSQEELRTVVGLPPGPPALGITIDGKCFRFEFVADNQIIELSAQQLHRRLIKQLTMGS